MISEAGSENYRGGNLYIDEPDNLRQSHDIAKKLWNRTGVPLGFFLSVGIQASASSQLKRRVISENRREDGWTSRSRLTWVTLDVWCVSGQSQQREDWSMSKFSKIRYVGLDVHKDTIVIAVADEGRDAARVIAEIPFEWNALRKVLD
jgi:hypothetical protein